MQTDDELAQEGIERRVTRPAAQGRHETGQPQRQRDHRENLRAESRADVTDVTLDSMARSDGSSITGLVVTHETHAEQHRLGAQVVAATGC